VLVSGAFAEGNKGLRTFKDVASVAANRLWELPNDSADDGQ
jgi:hypothetical protein